MSLRSLYLTAFISACLTALGSAEEPRHPIAEDVASQLPGADGAFVLVVELRAKPDSVDALIAAMADAPAATRREPGNLAYDLSRQAADPVRFMLYERWKSIDALDSHLRQPYLAKLLNAFDAVLAEPPEVNLYLPVGQD